MNNQKQPSKREHQRYQAEILIQRLARLSADSSWARRASGVRAAIDKALSQSDGNHDEHLALLIERGFELLEKAAAEIPAPEDILLGLNRRNPK